jgi:hypothetical protein
MDFSRLFHRATMPQGGIEKVFQAMMWLGRTEWYCGSPNSALGDVPEKDLQRQTIGSVLILEALQLSASDELLGEMEEIIKGFVGEQDNITPAQLNEYIQGSGLATASELADITRWRSFQNGLLQHSFAFQRINSQILWSDPGSPDQIQPAAAFLLLGQRFIVDSYVTGNVVYDRILYQGQKVLRMLPSTLDVLFALGNDAALQLLQGQMEQYPYATNLAALRYLIDAYEPAYWERTLYTAWLRAPRPGSTQRTDGSSSLHADCCLVAERDEHAARIVGATAARQPAVRQTVVHRGVRLFVPGDFY